VQGAADNMDVQLCEVGQRCFKEGPSRLSDRGVGGRQVFLRGGAQPGGDGYAILASGAADFSDMRGTVAIEMMSGDFDDVEAQPGDFLHVFQAVGAPLLLPVRVVNAEFQLHLHFSRQCVIAHLR
jgi:hypothetical protein